MTADAALPEEAGFRAELRTPAAAAVAGMIFAGILIAVLLLMHSSGAGGAQTPDWLTDPDRRRAVSIATSLIPFAGISFLWFIGVVRSRLGAREVCLHPVTITQNARTSGGGNVALVPTAAMTVGPRETWKAEKVSIWHPGHHDNPFGIRLTALMISKRIPDAAVPMSLLADHPNVQFNYLRGGIGSVAVEMH